MKEPRLPMDVLIEVLILLPLKSILKFRCVSKTWRDLISSALFVDRHLKFGRKHSVLLLKRIPNHGLTPQSGESQMLSFHDPDFHELLVSPDLYIPISKDLHIPSYKLSNLPIHGPCNGLVCIALEKNVFLCNPALREFKLLPPLKYPENYTAPPLGYGFGFDQIGGVYKVIQISYEHDLVYDIRVDLYDSASNSWKQIEAKVPDIIESLSVGLLFKGAIHWYANTDYFDDHPFVLCFDMSSEDFQHLDFHDNFSPPKGIPELMELDGCLALVFNNFSIFPEVTSDIEIWVMKKYGKKESLTKHSVIRTFSLTKPLLFLKNEWLVFQTFKGQLAACTNHGNGFKEFEIYGSPRSMSAVIYEESLISLKDIISNETDC